MLSCTLIILVVTAERCVELYNDSCLSLPENLDSVVAVWPQHPQSDFDCECPLFESDGNHNFSQCYCFVDKLTTFDVKLKSHKLCWNNLTYDTNNTKIILYKGTDLKTSPSDSFDVTYSRQIYNQTEISLQGKLCTIASYKITLLVRTISYEYANYNNIIYLFIACM